MTEAGTTAEVQSDLPQRDCRAQLERILRSADFEATSREHRFLGHVVEETLSGRGDRIKAYSIAVEVFGRDASFDPQTDPIVRVEAGHLRRSLERYYLTAGHNDPILIEIPKGGYVPTFSARTAVPLIENPGPAPLRPPPLKVRTAPRWPAITWQAFLVAVLMIFAVVVVADRLISKAPSTAKTPEIPRLLVENFEDLSANGTFSAISVGLTQEIVGQLSKFKDIVVVVAPTPGKPTLAPRFVLAGSVDLTADIFRLRVRLMSQSDGAVLWANSYDGSLKVSELLKVQADIARNVATSLAQTYGVIYQADAVLRVDNPPNDWAAYSCTLTYYAYRSNLDPRALPWVRNCLESAVQHFPDYATAWGLLSQTYIDELRFIYPLGHSSWDESVERALATAKTAVELDPLNIRSLQAQMLAMFFNKEYDAAIALGQRAMAINPNDTELMGEFGYRLAMSGNWAEGCPMVTRARELNPGPSVYYDLGMALCTYFQGDFPQAAIWIRQASSPENVNYHAIATAIFAEGGYREEADRERKWLQANAPALMQTLPQELSRRLGRQQDVDFFLGSIDKAGRYTPD
jgi:TolB-like protein/Tfp pilus assembly protein PilF